MSPTIKKGFRLALIVLVLAIPLALLLSRVAGGFVRDVVAAPFLYLAWIARVYLRTVPRTLFWGGLLLFGLALALMNALVALGGDPGSGTGARELPAIESNYTGKVSRLTSQIRFAERSTYFRRRLAKRLGGLILRSMDRSERYSLAEVERALDELGAPRQIRGFLREAGGPIPPAQRVGLIAWLRGHLLGRPGAGVHGLDLDELVQFLEDRLEAS